MLWHYACGMSGKRYINMISILEMGNMHDIINVVKEVIWVSNGIFGL